MIGLRFRVNICALFFLSTLLVQESAYSFEVHRKASEDNEVVKNKLFPKIGTSEASLPAMGMILNQSLVSSILIHGSLGYFIDETWGLHLEMTVSNNQDVSQRNCLENFYYDPFAVVDPDCALPSMEDEYSPLFDEDGNPKKGAGFKPVYIGVREIEQIITASVSWNPIYGKQLAFLRYTSYFDIFFKFGVGITNSSYYPKTTTAGNGKPTIGSVTEDYEGGCPADFGVCPNKDTLEHRKYIGKDGRPAVEKQSSPTLTLAVGQKFHFMRRFHILAELRNYTLFTEEGAEAYFAIWGGVGLRI